MIGSTGDTTLAKTAYQRNLTAIPSREHITTLLRSLDARRLLVALLISYVYVLSAPSSLVFHAKEMALQASA